MKSYTTKKGLQLRNWKELLSMAVNGSQAAKETLTIYADSNTVGIAGSLDCRLNRAADGTLADADLVAILETIIEHISGGFWNDALGMHYALVNRAADVLEQEEEDRIQLRAEIYERAQARNSAFRRAESWA